MSSGTIRTRGEYFDGLSAVAQPGELVAGPDDLLFVPDGDAPRENFAYGQITEVSPIPNAGPAKSAGFRIVIFIDAAESRELRFTDAAFARDLNQVRTAVERSRGLIPGWLAEWSTWSVGQRVLIGALVAPVSLAFFIFAVGQSHYLVPRAADRYLGEQVDEYLAEQFSFCSDPALESALDDMLVRLVGEEDRADYRLHLVENETVNALAAPGGSIYVFAGLMAESETPDEVAGVLAHEVGHIQERHSIRQMIQIVGYTYMMTMVLGAGFEEVETAETLAEIASLVTFLKYSRDFEREADLAGVRLLEASDLSAQGLMDFFGRRAEEFSDADGDAVNADESAEAEASTEAAATAADSDDQDLGEQFGEALESVQEQLEDAVESLPDLLQTHPGDAERLQALREATTRAAESGSIRPLDISPQRWRAIRDGCMPEYGALGDL